MQPEVYREMAAIQASHWWFVARRKILASVLNTLSLPPNARLAELGCGTGANLAMLSGFGKLSAMENDEEAQRYASLLGICSVDYGFLPDMVPFENGIFDLVCLLDVLEHIENDECALAAAAKLLKPSGRMLVTVPAYALLWSAHDDAHHHYRRYTTNSFRKVVTSAGLKINRLGYFNTLLFPCILAARIAGKFTASRHCSDAAMPLPWINRLLTSVFGCERYMLPRFLFPFGTSVLAVLEVQNHSEQ